MKHMDFIYFSLYTFYTKVIRVQSHHPPIVSVAGLLSALEVLFIFAIINTAIYMHIGTPKITYNPIIVPIVYVIVYFLNYKKYSALEKDIIERINCLSIKKKVLSHTITFFISLFIFWAYLYDGLYIIIEG